MTDDVVGAADPLEKAGVYFCLVSEQAAVNLLPVAYYRPKEVVLFVSDKMQAAADLLHDAMNKASPGIKVSHVRIEDPYDLNGCRAVFLDALAEREAEHPVINVTGGTKIMALSAVTAAYAAGVQTFYLNEETNVISLIDPYSENAARDVRSIAMRMKLETYLAAYGFKVTDSTPSASLSFEELSLVKDLLSMPSLKKVVPRLNELAVRAEDNDTMSVSSADVPDALKPAFDTLCDRFAETGHLHISGRTVVFPSEADRFFVAGGWLERYVYNELSCLKLKPVGNLVVKKPTKNELDAAFMHEGTFWIVECKTGNLSNIDEANKVVYKLETLKKMGGRKTRLLLVTYRPLHEEALDRAKNAGIQVLEGDDLLRLRNTLSTWLQ